MGAACLPESSTRPHSCLHGSGVLRALACRFFALKHGNAMFHEGGTVGKRVSWSSSDENLQRWKEGKTGLPLVDANMRELAATGVPWSENCLRWFCRGSKGCR